MTKTYQMNKTKMKTYCISIIKGKKETSQLSVDGQLFAYEIAFLDVKTHL